MCARAIAEYYLTCCPRLLHDLKCRAMSKRKRALKQHDNKIGYWTGKGDQREFVPLANFGVRILRFVTAPAQLPDYKGYRGSNTGTEETDIERVSDRE